MNKETKFVLFITGPAGSGKSTVSEKVANQLEKCVNIDADRVKHMIVSGFYKDQNSPSGWGYSQWGLVGDSIGILAANFLKKGYSVIINGYIGEPAWTNLRKHVTLTYKILLMPHIDTVYKRDSDRHEKIRMGAGVVDEHYRHFSTDNFFEDFIKLDTTGHSVDETVSKVLEILAKTDPLTHD